MIKDEWEEYKELDDFFQEKFSEAEKKIIEENKEKYKRYMELSKQLQAIR